MLSLIKYIALQVDTTNVVVPLVVQSVPLTDCNETIFEGSLSTLNIF